MADDDRFEIRQRDDPTPELGPGPSEGRRSRLRRPISWPLWRFLALGLLSFFMGVCVGVTPTTTTDTETSIERIEDVLPRVTTTVHERTTTTAQITTTLPPTTTTAAPTTAAPSPPVTQGFRQAPPPQSNCDPSYPDFCIPPPPPDLDCGDTDQKNFTVHQPDPHDFDGNRDGVGCES